MKSINIEQIPENEIEEGAPYAALSYVFFLWVLTYRFCKTNRFARTHARQGIVIFTGEIICAVLAMIPLIGIFFYLFGMLFFLIVSVRGLYAALTGKFIRMPGISAIADTFVV